MIIRLATDASPMDVIAPPFEKLTKLVAFSPTNLDDPPMVNKLEL